MKKILCFICLVLVFSSFTSCTSKIEPTPEIKTSAVVAEDIVFVDAKGNFQGVDKRMEKKNTEYGIGFYTLESDYGVTDDFDRYVKSPYVNTFISSASRMGVAKYMLEKCKENKSQLFIFLQHSLFQSNGRLLDNWKETWDKINQEFVDTGDYEALAGWYFDEPQGAVADEDLIALQEYNHTKYKKKFFVCFSPMAIDRNIYSQMEFKDIPYIKPETSKYITDCSFNMYYDVKGNEDLFRHVRDKMKELMGATGKTVRVWYTPATFAFRDSSEDYSIIHTNFQYTLLKEEPNPGGLLCYTYSGLGAEIPWSFRTKTNPDNPKPWNRLKSYTELVGEEICTGVFKELIGK